MRDPIDWNDIAIAVIGGFGLIGIVWLGKVIFAGLDALAGK